MHRVAILAAAAFCVMVATGIAAHAQQAQFGPGDPGAKDATQFDAVRPIANEMQTRVPDGFVIAEVGDLIISRPLSQYAERLPGFAGVLHLLQGATVAHGNLETTIFDPRSFRGAPYANNDWTNASLPAVATRR